MRAFTRKSVGSKKQAAISIIIGAIIGVAIDYAVFSSLIYTDGDSMEPALSPGWHICIKQPEYRIGDIVRYKNTNPEINCSHICHRIVDENEYYYKICGDNPKYPDNCEKVEKNRVVCKIIF